MAQLVTIVSGTVPPERVTDVQDEYERSVADRLPPGLERTFLLQSEPGVIAIASVWRDRAALEAMIATGQEPLARRLIREAGGTPEPAFYDVIASATA